MHLLLLALALSSVCVHSLPMDSAKGEAEVVVEPHTATRNLIGEAANLTICIPCIPRDTNYLSYRLLPSIARQTVKPREVIVAMSDMSEEDGERAQRELSKIFPVKVVATEAHQWAGQNRDRAAAAATSAIISFMDADDEMHDQRIQIVRDALESTEAACAIHGITLTNDTRHTNFANWSDYSFVTHHKYDMYTQPLEMWWEGKTYYPLHTGMPTCRASVFEDVKFGWLPRGQDGSFKNELLWRYSDGQLVLLDIPLGIYYPSTHFSNFAWPAWTWYERYRDGKPDDLA